MKYPRLNNLVILKRVDAHKYKAKNILDGTETYLSADIACFAKKLDGRTDPDTIGAYTDEERRQMLLLLKRRQMLRFSRVLTKSCIAAYITMWIPSVTRRLRFVGALWNLLLLLLWLPVLAVGICSYCYCYIPFDLAEYLLGSVVGLVAGVFLHEFSHASAALAYNAPFLEMGISIGLIPGAYVITNTDNVRNRWHEAQIYAAGLEMNFLIGGLFLLLSSKNPSKYYFLIGIAANNIVLGLVNMMLTKGFDGMRIVDCLFGTNSLSDLSFGIIFSRENFRKLKKSSTGQAFIAVSIMMAAAQIALPAFIVLNIVEVILCLL